VLIYWTDYRARVEAEAIVRETCVECGTVYLYRVHCTATGSETSMLDWKSGSGQQAANEQAMRILERNVKEAWDEVPCPVCGCYQPRMVAGMAAAEHGSLREGGRILKVFALVAAVMAIVGPLTALLEKHPWLALVVFVFCVATAVPLYVLGRREHKRYVKAIAAFDPNTTSRKKRIRLGRERAVTQDEYELGFQPPKVDDDD
jgi:hypothetical protein